MFITDFLRNRALKKHRRQVRTNITPLKDIRTAVTVIDVEDTSFDNCKKDIMAFYRDNGIKGEIFFFDFRKIGDAERLITSITNTVLKKDLNFYGKPAREKLDLMLEAKPDLFISLINKDDYPIQDRPQAASGQHLRPGHHRPGHSRRDLHARGRDIQVRQGASCQSQIAQ